MIGAALTRRDLLRGMALACLPAAAGVATGRPRARPDASLLAVRRLEHMGEGIAASDALDGGTLRLTDGRTLRLAAIRPTVHPLDRLTEPDWPLAETARQALADLVVGRALALYQAGPPVDRYGSLVAHVLAEGRMPTDPTRWLQGAMLQAGLARVETQRDRRVLAAPMLAAERTARNAGLGLWRHPYYRPIGPFEARDAIGGFRLVEGRVLDVATVRGTTYLNFGPDWRWDFTVSFRGRTRRLFERAEIDPQDYSGRVVRVRGWLIERNGPMIEATHPEQIELFV